MVTDARRRVQETKREEHRRQADADRRAQETREATKAWRTLYGREVANQLDVHTAYSVLDAAAGRFIFAVPDELEPRLRAALGGGDIVGQSTGAGIGKITSKLSQGHQLDLVVTDDAGIEQAVAMVRHAEQQRRDAHAAEARAHAVTAARKREEARQLSTFGVTLPADE